MDKELLDSYRSINDDINFDSSSPRGEFFRQRKVAAEELLDIVAMIEKPDFGKMTADKIIEVLCQTQNDQLRSGLEQLK